MSKGISLLQPLKADSLVRSVGKPILLLASVFLLLAPVQAQNESNAGPARERFIPADQLESVFQRSPKGVVLPRAEFQALLEQAQKAQAAKSVSPAASVIRSAVYDVSQSDKHAVVKLSLEIDQFSDDWVTVNIPIGNLSVEKASISDEPATVGRDPKRADILTLIRQKRGRFTLDLELSTPLATVGSDQIAAFRVVPNVASVVNVSCPAERHLEFNDLKLERPAADDQTVTYSIPAGNHQNVRLKWTSKKQETTAQTLVFARTDGVLLLSRDNLRWSSDTRVSVFGNSINKLIARVPSSLEVTNVESAGLESWTLEDDPEMKSFTRVVLNYRQPFTEDRLIKLSAVAALNDDGSLKLPTLEMVNVTSHTGRLYVSHEDQLRLLASVGGGVRHLGTTEASDKSPGGEVFDFWLQDYNLSVAIKPRDRELFAEVNSTLSVVDSTATFTCEMTIETLNSPLFEQPLRLPDGWQVTQITGQKKTPIKWRSGSDANIIVVEPNAPVQSGQLFAFTATFTKSITDPSTIQTLDLPTLTAVDTLLVGGTYQISAAPDLTLAPIDISGLSAIGDESGTLLFETQGTSYSGRLSVVRKPVRLSSRAVIRSWMDTRQKSVESVVTVDVLNGTTRTLEVKLPEDMGDEVRFSVVSITQVPGIKNQQAPAVLGIIEQTPGEVADGKRTFSLTFDKRFWGAVTLRTFVQQARDEESKLTAPFVEVTGAIRQHGLVVFEAYPEQQLAPANDDLSNSGLNVTDSGLVEPPGENLGRRVALVYRYVRPGYTLELTETRFDTEAVPSAVCRQIANISVLNETGAVQRSCKATFRCVGVQTLRFTLPDSSNSFLWSTILNNEAVEVRRDGDDFLVAIPTNSEQSQHTLEILFESRDSELSVLGEMTQKSILLSIDTDQGKASPIDILEQTWEVRYPSTAMLVNHDGGFHPQSALEQPGWLQSVATLLYVPSWNQSFERLVPVIIGLFVLLLLTALILRRRWKSLFAVCFIGLFVVPILLLSKPAREYSQVTKTVPNSVSAYADDDPFEYDMEVAETEHAPADFFAEPMEAAGGGSGIEPFSRRSRRDMQRRSGGMAGGGFGGGMGGFGGQQGGATPGSAGGRQGGEMGIAGRGLGMQAGAEFQQTAPGQMGQAGDQRGQQSTPAIPPLTNTPPVVDSTPGRIRTGSARLSVRAAVAAPNDYRTMQFRSIGATQNAGTMDVVIQKRSQLKALRTIAAAIIVLLCLWMTAASIYVKTGFAIILVAATAAAVPLVPSEWQSVVDGVGLGILIGISWWLICCCVCCAKRWWQCFRNNGCCGFFKPNKATTGSLILLAAVSVATGTVNAAPQDQSKQIRPDIVLPYSPDGPELLADRVFLPQEDFLKLYRLAYPNELNDKHAPATGSVVAAFYKSAELKQIKDSNWTQEFTVRYVIRSHSTKPITVPLPIGKVAIRSAKLGESSAVLTATPDTEIAQPQQPNAQGGQQGGGLQRQQKSQQADSRQVETSGFTVRIPSEGTHVLDLTFEVSATVENSVGKLSLPLLPVPAGTLVFELPEEQLEARVNGRSNLHRKDGTSLIVPVAAARTTRIDWRPLKSEAVSDTIFHAEVTSALALNDAGLTVRSSAKINCRQGKLAEVEVKIPADYAVQTVEGPDVAGWNVFDDDLETLRVLFKKPVESATSIDLTLFQRTVFSTQKTDVAVPVPAFAGASRDSGTITVMAGRELEVRVDSLSDVSQVNAAESTVPKNIDSNLRKVLSWRYTRQPVAVSVRVSRTADRLKIALLNGVQLESQRQLWTTLLTASNTGSPRRRLEITVPADFLALDISADDLADWYYTDSADEDSPTKILNVQFNRARRAANIVIQGQTGRGDDAASATLTAPQVADADESETKLSIWLDAASEIASATAEGWKRAGGEIPIDPRILKLQSDAPDISFSGKGTSLKPVTLALRQAEASLIAESVSVTNVTDTSIDLTLGLNWRISRAATRELSFTLPAQLADVFDFQVPALRQIEKTESGGRVQITLHLQQPVSGQFFVLGTGTLPLPDSKQVDPQSPEFVVGENSKSRVSSQSHFWVIVNHSAGLLEAVDLQNDGDDVAPDEIKTNIPEGFLQQSVAIRRLNSDQPNSAWQLKFPERQQVAPAVVALAAHATIIAEDGTWRSRHTLQVRNESRQFLPVLLPDNSRVLYCLVKGKPTRVVTRPDGNRTLHLIPVPQSGEISTPFEVQFALAGILSQFEQNLAGRDVEIPCPTFPEYRDFPDYGITVSRNTWSVYVPDEWYASLVKNPRQTNVITATIRDFQDAALMCSVDNLNSIVSSLSSSRTVTGGTKLVNELQRQELELQSIAGNSRATESKREQALAQVRDLLSNKLESAAQEEAAQIQYNGVAANQGRNRFLEQQEITSNTFNQDNGLQLFRSNAGSGVDLESAEGSMSFNFVLPEEEPTANESLGKIVKGQTAAPRRGSATRAPKPEAAAKGNQSQLLLRRKFNREMQVDKVKGKVSNDSGKSDAKKQPAFGIQPPGMTPQSGPQTLFESVQNAVPSIQDFDGEISGFPTTESFVLAAPQGLLSLNFQLPEDGVRHDFVRTGGNASLTLKIRSNKSVKTGFGIGWAVVCFVLAIILLKGPASGSSLVTRVLVVSSLVALAGWLFLPNPIREVCLAVCIISAIAVCVFRIVRTFRSPVAT